MQKGEADNYYPRLIAMKLAVAGNAIAATDLDWVGGANFNSHVPTFAVITYGSGTLGIIDIDVKADGIVLESGLLLSSLDADATRYLVDLTSGALAFTSDDTLFLNVDVQVASVAASTFNIYVYGVTLN